MHHEGFSVVYEGLSERGRRDSVTHTHTHSVTYTHTHARARAHTPAARHSANDPSGVDPGQDSGSLNAALKYLLPRVTLCIK